LYLIDDLSQPAWKRVKDAAQVLDIKALVGSRFAEADQVMSRWPTC
jgi:hypothetical protein